MRRFVGWICDGCNRHITDRPWDCPGCKKEICDYCGWMFATCKSCCEGKTEKEIALLANATGDWEFETEGLDNAKKQTS